MLYKKTELGSAAVQSRSIVLTAQQRSALILFDGKRQVEAVLKSTAGLGVTADDVRFLVDAAMLTEVEPLAASSDRPVSPVTAVSAAPASYPRASLLAEQFGSSSALDQAHFARAYPIAARLTASLGLRGFMLNLAVEAAGDLRKLQALAPKIRDAVGPEKFKELDAALYD